jgi:hypothetical protein
MPGRPNGNQKRRAANQKRHKELETLRAAAVKSGVVPHGVDPVKALQTVIDNAFARYLGEMAMNEQRRAEGDVISDARERQLEKDVAYYASLAMQYNLGDRMAAAREASLIKVYMLLFREATRTTTLSAAQKQELFDSFRFAAQRVRQQRGLPPAQED